MGDLGVFDETLENAVKEFQENRKECELYRKDDNGKQLTDNKGNPIFVFDGQAGKKPGNAYPIMFKKNRLLLF